MKQRNHPLLLEDPARVSSEPRADLDRLEKASDSLPAHVDAPKNGQRTEANDDHVADNFIFLFPLSLFTLLATFAAVLAWG